MVSYVLLIIIAVGLSVAVYSFLKVYIPKYEAPECNKEVQISIAAYTCDNNLVSIELTNRGLFNLEAVYVRIAEEGRKVKKTISPSPHYLTPVLAPGETSLLPHFPFTIDSSGFYDLEIEPAILNEEGNLALCPEYTITKTINCSV